MPVEDLTDRRAGYSRATSGCGKLPSPGEREGSVTLAAAPLDQRDEAQQRGEHEVIARRQAVAGQCDQPGCDERGKAAEDRYGGTKLKRADRPETARTIARAERRCTLP